MEEIGYDDYFFGNGVCMIEWAELIEELIPENSIHVTIEKDLEKDLITVGSPLPVWKDGRTNENIST